MGKKYGIIEYGDDGCGYCLLGCKKFLFQSTSSTNGSRIKTVTGFPNFPSYTSGHSTFSGAAATILAHIIPSNATEYTDMAKEASLSRMYACNSLSQ